METRDSQDEVGADDDDHMKDLGDGRERERDAV